MLDALQSLAPVGAAILFGWGVYQFFRTTEISFRKPFWEAQLKLYLEITSATGTLAQTTDADRWKAASEDFWRLYYGPLCLVENKEVEGAMVNFAGALSRATASDTNRDRLRALSLKLADACRRSLGSGLNLTLEQLTKPQVVSTGSNTM